MNLTSVKNAVVGTTSKVGFWFKKHSPEILLVTGLVGIGAAVVIACVQSTKLEKTLEPTNKQLEGLRKELADDNKIASGEVDPKIVKREMVKVYAKTGLNIAKLYALPFGILGGSVAMILFSHKIIKGRELAAVAAYSSLSEVFKKYREAVKGELGEDKENDIFIGTNDVTVEKDEEGTVIKTTVNQDNLYTYLFDECNSNWTRYGKTNVDFLLMTEKYLNETFRCKGYMFLYEVYDALGVDLRTIDDRKVQASHVLGWIYDPKDSSADNYISFGLSDRFGNLNKRTMNLIRNGEKSIWLTFNPDGDILTGDNGRKTFMSFARS